MIVTPEQVIKQYFPEAIETTRELYERLDLAESGYSYLNWLQDAEQYCFSNFVNEEDYKLLPDRQKNYWISKGVFLTLIQSSPSKICDQIRTGLMDISHKVATDRTFARQLRDQLDQEYGIKTVTPKLSKKLKSKYNETGQDGFEFSIQADNRLYIDIISGYDFQPEHKIKNVFIFFKLEVEQGVPFHIVDITLLLTNKHTLSYRTVWCCGEERQRYGSILSNRVIRVNLFGDNKKLVDSYDYNLGHADIKNLEQELEQAISMIMEIELDEIDVDRLGEKILNRHNLNDEAYSLAIKAVIPTLPQHAEKENPEMVEAAFIDAVNKYWEYYLLPPAPAEDLADDLDQMVKDRMPRVTLALITAKMLGYDDLCEKYFKRVYNKKQKQALLSDGNVRLIYALAATTDLDPTAAPDKRINDMGAFIADHFDVVKNMFMEAGRWPSK